jgi:hypothetical protein
MTIEIKATEIKLVLIDSIHPWEENANSHPDQQIDDLVEQYKFNGMSSPLEVEQGTNDIVAGCGRWLAAKKAGMKKVPVYFRTYETYSHKYARMVADNGTARQSMLDLTSIHENLKNLHLDSIDLLGIANFRFEPDEQTSIVNDIKAEWDGMPEFENADERPFRTIYVHFHNKEAVAEFFKMIKQDFTEDTKSIWHPKRVNKVRKNLAYEV